MKIFPKHILAILLILLFCNLANAQNLFSSLAEVNSRWIYENDFPREVYEMPEENNPIQTHLLLVHQTLGARSIDHLSDFQKENRSKSLIKLKAYALNGEFPNNISHTTRRPVFIGSNGNYCAVGHLIKESGCDPLARKISNKMNYHYLLEMRDEELNSWLALSGFTAEELAWIQPSYSPPSIAQKMGSGFNGPVNVIFSNSSNEIIAGGVFDSAGSINTKGISIWVSGIAGFDWLNMSGTGLEYSVEDMIEFNGGLVVSGDIYKADSIYVGSGIVFWDGTKWSEMGSFYIGALQNIVYDLEIYNGELYAGGMFRNDFSNPSLFSNIAKWDGTKWIGLPGSPQGVVYAMEVHQNELILGGTFNSIDTVNFNHIASYDGTQFKHLANGVSTSIFALKSVGDTLYAGGEFLNGSLQDTFGFGFYSNNSWTRVSSPHLQINGWGHKVESIESTPHGIFIGGDLDYFPLVGTYAKNLLRYTNGELEPFAILDSTVKTLKYIDGILYAGGKFTSSKIGFSPNDSVNHITFFDLRRQFSLNEKRNDFKSQLFPNPAISSFTFRLEQEQKIKGFALYDLLGKKMDFKMMKNSELEYSFSTAILPKGLYILKVETEKGYADKKIILGE